MPRALNDNGSFKYSGITGKGLGYYVHYRASRYREYGINVNTTDGITLTEAIEQNHSYLKNIVQQNESQQELDLKGFEEMLNSLIDPESFRQELQNRYDITPELAAEIEKE